jgi:hypothetical protein
MLYSRFIFKEQTGIQKEKQTSVFHISTITRQTLLRKSLNRTQKNLTSSLGQPLY